MDIKKEISKSIKKEVKLGLDEVEKLIEKSRLEGGGDYAFPCFLLAVVEKKSPLLIAEELKEKVSLPFGISNTEAKAGYLNFFIDKKILIDDVLKNSGKNVVGKEKKRIMIEFPSPNTNKPLHIGHLRNMAIGESISRILEFFGNKVVRTSLNNDRGVHICKSMVAYGELGKSNSPEKQKKKSDHFVGDYYVLFGQKSMEDEKKWNDKAQECLVRWEQGDKKVISLWKKMNSWALNGFKETYKLYGIKHDREYFESEFYKEGKGIVEKGLMKKIFKKNKDGVVVINIGKQGNEDLGEKIVLRADGTSVYITQDLYLAWLKDKEYKLDGSIYVVGNEQEYHFKVLFYILKKFGFKFSDNLHHLSYGMVMLPEGKMKSREGKIVDADDLILSVQELARKELKSRYKLSKKELEDRSLKITLAAIKYNLLKVDIRKNTIFNPNEAVSFEGDTGPYLLYSYARASSILRKAGNKNKKVSVVDLKKYEERLLKKLSDFEDVLVQAREKLSPTLIANYAYSLSQVFNDFYHNCPVIGSLEEGLRLKLVKSFKDVLKQALNLIGIKEIEEM